MYLSTRIGHVGRNRTGINGVAVRRIAFLPLRDIGLDGRIRTYDLLVPNQALYQTKLHRVGIGEGNRTPIFSFGD